MTTSAPVARAGSRDSRAQAVQVSATRALALGSRIESFQVPAKAPDRMSRLHPPSDLLLLRLHWPRLPSCHPEADVQLLGVVLRRHGGIHEVLVTGAAEAGAAGHSGTVVGTVCGAPHAGNRLNLISDLRVLLHPAKAAPGGVLPIPLPAAINPGPRTQRARREHTQPAWESVQVILYEPQPPLYLLGTEASDIVNQPPIIRQPTHPPRRKFGAQLVSHLLGALLALAVVLAHRRGLAAAAGSGGDWLARFVSSQLGWFMTAQPAGVPGIHQQQSEFVGGWCLTIITRFFLQASSCTARWRSCWAFVA